MIENTGLVTQIIVAVIGILVLVSGRRLFWLTVAAVGFVTGLVLTLTFLKIEPVWLGWIIAIIAGGLGVLLAIFLQKVAVSVVGFLIGGYALIWFVQFFGFNPDGWQWLIFIIGGVVGAILVAALFEMALIGLSSLVGATLIVQVANFSPGVTTLLFFILLLVGIAIQSSKLGQPTPARRQ